MNARYNYLPLLAIISFFPASASANVVSWNVALNTNPLIGNAAGPFSLEFQFTDGSGLSDGNNTATVSGLQVGSGALGGVTSTFGSTSGTLPGSLTLTDTSFFSQYIQSFTPGSTLSFTLSVTNNVDAGGVPDEFSFAILDKTAHEIPSTGLGDALVLVDINSAHPTLLSFPSDTSRNAGGGAPIALAAATITPAVVPEPSLTWLAAAGTVLLAAARHRRR
jgi:hypothetical protein